MVNHAILILKINYNFSHFHSSDTFSVGLGFRVDSNKSGKMQSGRVESRAVLTLVILTG